MQNQHNLKSGTKLNQYKIIRVLGEGGFGITYLAKDTSLGLEVVIKEYFPNEFAMRSTDSTITAKSKSLGDYSKGMQRFKEEAQTLAKFNHPAIVKILSYFEANNTAYFVMEYEEGTDLSQYLKEKGKGIAQEEILSIMMPILEGLKEVHAHKYLHRDIKPGNILLRANNTPVLIDFGASKLAIGEASRSITSMLTEGYAPLEQYSTDIKKQGPFTDLYAIAAVIYKMITGEVPPSSQTRSYALLSEEDDPFEPLTTLKLSGYDVNFLKAVDRALSINAKNRPQNVQEFQENIAGKFVQKEKKADVVDVKKENTNETKKNNSSLMIALVVMIVIAGGVLGYMLLNKQNVPDGTKVVQTQSIEEVKKEKEKISEEKGKERKEAEKIVEEVMKKMQEEKEVITPLKTVIPKVPVWDAYKAEQVIYDKLRNYGDIRAYGFDHTANQYPSVKLKHSMIGFYDFPFSSGKHIVAIASTAPEKNFDAHVFAPKLSFFEFEVINGEWVIKKEYINALPFGSWGRAPEAKDINVAEWGKDKFGLIFDSSYSNQGYTEEMKTLYILDDSKVKNIFSEEVASDDGGTGNNQKDWKATFSFDTSATPFYDIVLHKIGKEDGKPIDEKIEYKYNGQKYVKQKQVQKSVPITSIEPTCSYYTVKEVKQLNIRDKPGNPSNIIGRVNLGDRVCIYEFTGKWGRSDRGWISGKYLKILNKEEEKVRAQKGILRLKREKEVKIANEKIAEEQQKSVSTSNIKNKDHKLNKLRQRMKYSKARSIILDASWQGKDKRWQDVPESGTVNHLYYINGWTEIDDCAGSGLGQCRFEFQDMYGRTLVVGTAGECLTEKGELPEDNETCELLVSNWYIE